MRVGGWGRRSTNITRPHLDDENNDSAQASPRDGWGRRSTNITRPAQEPTDLTPRNYERRAVITGTQLAAFNPGRDPEFWLERASPRIDGDASPRHITVGRDTSPDSPRTVMHGRRSVLTGMRTGESTPRVLLGEYSTAGGDTALEERAAAAAAAPAPAWQPARAGRPPVRLLARGAVPPLRLDSVVAPAPPLGGAISERLHEHRAAAPLVRLARPSSSRERLKARLVAADVEPIDALDDFVRRKGQRAYRVRASIRDDVVGLQHKYDLMKQMVEGRVQHYGAREKIGRR